MTALRLALACISCFFLSATNGFSVSTVRSIHTSALFAEPRQPRRNLKKRRSRQKKDKKQQAVLDTFWETGESRPLVADKAIEAGEDYWIDEKDQQNFQQKEQAIKNRKAMEGEIPKEKLWDETLAPYKQNWIGVISVVIVILATIITKFPELLEIPTPSIPDL